MICLFQHVKTFCIVSLCYKIGLNYLPLKFYYQNGNVGPLYSANVNRVIAFTSRTLYSHKLRTVQHFPQSSHSLFPGFTRYHSRNLHFWFLPTPPYADIFKAVKRPVCAIMFYGDPWMRTNNTVKTCSHVSCVVSCMWLSRWQYWCMWGAMRCYKTPHRPQI